MTKTIVKGADEYRSFGRVNQWKDLAAIVTIRAVGPGDSCWGTLGEKTRSTEEVFNLIPGFLAGKKWKGGESRRLSLWEGESHTSQCSRKILQAEGPGSSWQVETQAALKIKPLNSLQGKCACQGA